MERKKRAAKVGFYKLSASELLVPLHEERDSNAAWSAFTWMKVKVKASCGKNGRRLSRV